MDISKKADEKTEIRQKIKRIRSELTLDQKKTMDEGIFMHFQKIYFTTLFEKCDIIYCYADCNNEVSTQRIIDFLWNHGKKTAFPRVAGKDMSFFIVNNKNDLEKGYMGILEPSSSCIKADEKNSIILVPGVAFSKNGIRLGYGGGFYDRFFEKEKEHTKIGLAYDFQIFDKLPAKPWDCKMDGIIIPEQFLQFRERTEDGKFT